MDMNLNKTVQDLRFLIDEVINSLTKEDAEIPILDLRSAVASCEDEIGPQYYGKLLEAKCYAVSAATGLVSFRQNCLSNLERSWVVFIEILDE